MYEIYIQFIPDQITEDKASWSHDAFGGIDGDDDVLSVVGSYW